MCAKAEQRGLLPRYTLTSISSGVPGKRQGDQAHSDIQKAYIPFNILTLLPTFLTLWSLALWMLSLRLEALGNIKTTTTLLARL